MKWARRHRRVRPIHQMEAAECGIACLAMVLQFHGCGQTLRSLRQACGTSRDGNSAKQLLTTARELGLEARGIRAEPAALRRITLPAIAHWNLNHFVVVERVSRDGTLTIVDPALGRQRVSRQSVDRSFTGIALTFAPTERLKQHRLPHPSVSQYFAQLRRFRSTAVFALLAGVCAQLFAVVAPATTQLLIDEVIRPARSDWLAPIVAIAFAAAAAQCVSQYIHQRALLSLQARLGLELTRTLGRQLLRLPLPFIDSRSRGDLLNRIQAQGSLGSLLSQTVLGVFDLLFVFLLTGLLLTYHPSLAALTLSLDAFRVVLMRALREECGQRAGALVSAQGREQAVLEEVVTQRPLIASFGVEEAVRRRFSERLRQRLKASVAADLLTTKAGQGLSVFDTISQAVVLLWGGHAVMAGSLTLGAYAGFLAIRALMAAPLNNLVATMECWLEVRGTLDRADDLLSEPVESPPTPQPSGPVVPTSARLELRGVSFRYGEGGPWILKDISLTVEPGEHVVLVGPSGQGKSTLLKIACGILVPVEGQVLLGGCPFSQYAAKDLRCHLGALVGDPVLIAGSVLENISMRLPGATEQQLHSAIADSESTSVLEALPGQERGLLEAGGVNLSGGERQRIGLAQVLLGQPAMLFLDEATCFLDLPTEARVLDNLARRGTTTLSVAHRPTVIRHADRIFEVRHGAIHSLAPPKRGSHLRLVQAQGASRAC